LELFCNAQQYNQTGMSWPTVLLKHSDWLCLRLMDQSEEILLGHAIFMHIRLAINNNINSNTDS